jgi:uncharacterized damage-inducible protein DinB
MIRAVCLTLALALPLSIVQPALSAQTPERPSLESLSGGVMQLYQSIRRNIIEAAEAMPEEHYAFRPTEDVRTFGQLVGHVANAQINFCSAGSTDPRPAMGNAEQLASKAELAAALKQSMDFCDRAFAAASDETLHAASTFGQVPITRGYALVYNIAHDNEHYGNMVTYMRMKGLVPPSSARGRR